MPGCVTAMLENLDLPSLQERRNHLRLIFMFKVVEGLVPAMPPDQFFTEVTRQNDKLKQDNLMAV